VNRLQAAVCFNFTALQNHWWCITWCDDLLTLRRSFHRYFMRLSTEGWPGWIDHGHTLFHWNKNSV